MPIYEYHCMNCSKVFEKINTVLSRNSESCPDCNSSVEIQISAPSRPVIYEYYDDGLGQQVTGPGHRRQLMRDRDLESK